MKKSWYVFRRWRRKITHVLVSQDTVELNDGLFFFKGESSSLNIWPQVVCPSKTATLATPLQTCNIIKHTCSSIISKAHKTNRISWGRQYIERIEENSYKGTNQHSWGGYANFQVHESECSWWARDLLQVSMDLFLAHSCHNKVLFPFQQMNSNSIMVDNDNF